MVVVHIWITMQQAMGSVQFGPPVFSFAVLVQRRGQFDEWPVQGFDRCCCDFSGFEFWCYISEAWDCFGFGTKLIDFMFVQVSANPRKLFSNSKWSKNVPLSHGPLAQCLSKLRLHIPGYLSDLCGGVDLHQLFDRDGHQGLFNMIHPRCLGENGYFE